MGTSTMSLPLDWFVSKTWGMTAEEKGAVIMLCCYYWNKGGDGVAIDHEIFARVVNVPLRKWNKLKGPVLEIFEEQDGYLFMPSLDAFLIVDVRKRRTRTEEWRRLREEVFARDDYTCTYCGKHGGPLECDHRIPYSRGGSDDLNNLVTACKPCNQAKRDKTPEEWEAARARSS